MDRRTLLVAGGAAAVLGLTGSPARAAARWPIFEWARPGGFFFPGEGLLTPPPLAVYDDNTGFADAAASLPLRTRQVESLRSHAEAVLANPRQTARDPGYPARGARPIDRLRVRREDGTFLTAELEDWGDGDPARAFPDALHELWAQVQDLRRPVLRGGEPWRPAAVLLATVHLDFEPDSYELWPAALPDPAPALYRERRLRAAAARAVRGELTPAPPGRVWPFYLVPRTRYVAATWRHLLPHE